MDYLAIKDLTFSYDGKKDIIQDVSFCVGKGKYITIIGQNGSGKSTIAKLIVGLLEKKEGSIYVDDIEQNEENLSLIRNKVGIVFQNPDNQFIGSTVRDDIAFGLENQCMDPNLMDDVILHFAQEVNMMDFLDKEPMRLSGGQKQRVAIAGVLAMAPELLVFDEATSMLDPLGKKEINELIKKIHEEKQLTIISITHDIEEVVHSDQVIVLDEGKVVLNGTPEEVLQQEELLVKLQLDVPFAYKLSKSLQKQGLKVKTHIDMEGLVDELCQLHSKM
jgi:ABC-type cobalt transport system, ATPase component